MSISERRAIESNLSALANASWRSSEAAAEARAALWSKIREAHAKGLPYRLIADLTGLSHQRIAQIVNNK